MSLHSWLRYPRSRPKVGDRDCDFPRQNSLREVFRRGRLATDELKKFGSGLTLLYANQCPWHINSVKALQVAAKKEGVKLKVIEIKTAKQAQESPTPFGVFSLIHNGKLLSYHYLSQTRFLNILKKELNK